MSDAPERDPELQAMAALARYLEPLGRDARKRVLSWAQARYIDLPGFDFSTEEAEGFRNYVTALTTAVRDLPGMSAQDILRGALELKRLSDEQAALESVAE